MQKALVCRQQTSRPSSNKKPIMTLKRKTGYDEKEDEAIFVARKRFMDMCIEQDD